MMTIRLIDDHGTIEREYRMWISLLTRVGKKDMLKDPYNIWVEAWSVASILAEEKYKQTLAQRKKADH
jgi:hypothetical protein